MARKTLLMKLVLGWSQTAQLNVKQHT